MSTKAYILIETAVGKSKSVSDQLREISSVVRVDAVTGPYDIIAVVNAPNLTIVGDLVTSQIHVIDGIIRTITCLSMGSGN
ncbi:MAG: AsnC family protein [Chloroflexi bacterium]|nr:MAG: AsnC family protein [Chloroflexota bacterium]